MIAEIEETGSDCIKNSDEKNINHFIPGTIVVAKADPNLKGVIVNITKDSPEDRISVFLNGETKIFYSSQIQLADKDNDTIEHVHIDHFLAKLTALQITNPGQSTLYSLNAAKIDFIPYQFRPVLRFIRSDRPRLLIADSVGVGKTIEAGLILRELQARYDISKILIICPKPLVTERKWQLEMKRFDEKFLQINSKQLQYCINETDMEGEWPDEFQKIIVSYSLFDDRLLYGEHGKKKRKTGLLDLNPPPKFDLVIVDEAHHIRNENTIRNKAVRFFCDNAEAAIFLTATPIQLGNNDLYTLLNTLRPDLIIDKESFIHMLEPNPFINQASTIVRSQNWQWKEEASRLLTAALQTSWGQAVFSQNPDFNEIFATLKKDDVGQQERVSLISKIENLNTFSSIINRTRRRDIGNFTIRKPETIEIEFTKEQYSLYIALMAVQEEIFSALHDNTNVRFMMTTIMRQAASSLYGLKPFLEDILSRHIDELIKDADEYGVTLDNINIIQDKITAILEVCSTLTSEDPKLDALLRIIQEKQAMSTKKIMIFSSFRHTLSYIQENLLKDGYKVGLIHGGISDDDRIEARAKFESVDGTGRIDIMLFSDVGCEGLDYQFCDCIINYDLPWNPMKIEQRIGRIDRNGQKSESIAIVNLITPGTIDAVIYERCLYRIGVFHNALGAGEEILGDITNEIRSIVDSYNLNAEEINEKLQQLSDNKVRWIKEQEELEEKQMEFFGLDLSSNVIKSEVAKASSFWLSPHALANLVEVYMKEKCGKKHDFLLGEKEIKTLRVSQDCREAILNDFYSLPKKKNQINRSWELWLKGENQHLGVTFQPEAAKNEDDLTFLNPIHPLIRQAANYVKTKQRFFTTVKSVSTSLKTGTYPFAIYQWQYSGIKDDQQFIAITEDQDLSNELVEILETASNCANKKLIDDTIVSLLDKIHYKEWSIAREKHTKNIQAIILYRKESLETSHKARISLLNDQLENTNDAKIKKMRSSQIGSAERDFEMRIKELDAAISRADIVSDPIAYGYITIERG